jgi:FKBP-type peptidyl-prolyl cis-trans isomerase
MKRIVFPTLGVLLVFTMFSFWGCSKSDDQAVKDHQLIQDYVNSHHLTGEFTASGLYYAIHDTGSTVHPDMSSTCTVDYKGYFLDDRVFDKGTNVQFKLSQVIKGWQEGLPLIGEGGKITLIIPSAAAYGENGAGTIPPNTVLGFDVTLHKVSNKE